MDKVKKGHHGLNQFSSTVHTESRIFWKILNYQTIYMKLRELIERVLKSISLYMDILSQLVKYTDTHA